RNASDSHSDEVCRQSIASKRLQSLINNTCRHSIIVSYTSSGVSIDIGQLFQTILNLAGNLLQSLVDINSAINYIQQAILDSLAVVLPTIVEVAEQLMIRITLRQVVIVNLSTVGKIANYKLHIIGGKYINDRRNSLRQNSLISKRSGAQVAQSIFQSGNIVSVVLISDVILLGGITQISSQLNRVTGSSGLLGLIGLLGL